MWRGFTELKPGTLARRARAVEGRSGVGPSCHPKGGVLAKHPALLSGVKEELLHLRGGRRSPELPHRQGAHHAEAGGPPATNAEAIRAAQREQVMDEIVLGPRDELVLQVMTLLSSLAITTSPCTLVLC